MPISCRAAALGCFVAVALHTVPVFAQTAPAEPNFSTPIEWARYLVSSLPPENNEYATSPTYVTWPLADGSQPAQARTMCNSFFSALLAKTYGFNETFFRFWTGGRSPTAAKYFEVMTRGLFFKKIDLVTDVKAGDILFVDYGDPTASSTGHIALLDAAPTVRYPQTAPFVVDTIQYDVPVIDSTRSGHGPLDTRRNTDGTWNSGVGRGTMRLYVNRSGSVVGYAWSAYSTTAYAINGAGAARTVVARIQM